MTISSVYLSVKVIAFNDVVYDAKIPTVMRVQKLSTDTCLHIIGYLLEGTNAGTSCVLCCSLVSSKWRCLFNKDDIWTMAIEVLSETGRELSGTWCMTWRKVLLHSDTLCNKLVLQQMYARRTNRGLLTRYEYDLIMNDILVCIQKALQTNLSNGAHVYWIYAYTLASILKGSYSSDYNFPPAIFNGFLKRVESMMPHPRPIPSKPFSKVMVERKILGMPV